MIFLASGLLIDLYKPNLDDLDGMAAWLELPEFATHVGGRVYGDRSRYRAYAQRLLQSNADDASGATKVLMAKARADGAPVGMALLSHIDWRNRHAQCSYIIGDVRHRTTLMAGDFNVTLYHCLLRQLGFNKIYGYVYANNPASLRLCGFGGHLEGTLRQHRAVEGGREDVLVYSMTQHDFTEFVRRNAAGVLRKHVARGLLGFG